MGPAYIPMNVINVFLDDFIKRILSCEELTLISFF